MNVAAAASDRAPLHIAMLAPPWISVPPLRSGATTQVKRPAEIAEVAVAAVRLDGVRQLVMTTGTSSGPDRGAHHLAKCVAAVCAVLPTLPIQVQIAPTVRHATRISSATAVLDVWTVSHAT